VNIEIHVDSKYDGNTAGCGIICTVTNGTENKQRRYGYALGMLNQSLASIKSVIAALNSVRIGYRDQEVSFYINNDYIAKLLEYDESGYTVEPEEYNDDVAKMRLVFSKFDNITVLGSGSKWMTEVSKLAETSMNTQLDSDTFTYDYNP